MGKVRGSVPRMVYENNSRSKLKIRYVLKKCLLVHGFYVSMAVHYNGRRWTMLFVWLWIYGIICFTASICVCMYELRLEVAKDRQTEWPLLSHAVNQG